LEVDVSLDLLAKKISTSKDILKRELNFQSKNQIDIDKQPIEPKFTNAHLVFQDIVTAEIVKSNFNFDKHVTEILNLSDEFTKSINEIKEDKDRDSLFKNISYTSEQYSESISRLYLYYANLKIDKLIEEFESSKNKDFSLLQTVEDIKKKIEIYQSTL
jgi:hypothetical protein